ncbi:hypothetical protein NC652_035633 [Populus alba x Populus x berolinensis]|nr:hypothetical protein NC652_035633 [Populus alba x Populus x berolinensis]
MAFHSFGDHEDLQGEVFEYLEDARAGKAKTVAGVLLPHEIIHSLNDYDGGEVAELWWTRMVDDLLQRVRLKNCLAVCDVSGSMFGTPTEVYVALGVLEMYFVKSMDLGMNTNFKTVSDIILQAAVKGKSRVYLTIKRVSVFSDMEFDQASTNIWETGYQDCEEVDSKGVWGLAAWHFLCTKVEIFCGAVSLHGCQCHACLHLKAKQTRHSAGTPSHGPSPDSPDHVVVTLINKESITVALITYRGNSIHIKKEMRMDRKRFHDVVPGEDCLDFSQYLDSMIVLLTRCHDVLSGVSLRKPILLPDSELSDRISELHSLQIISTTFLFSFVNWNALSNCPRLLGHVPVH